jgi:hypothetical protein
MNTTFAARISEAEEARAALAEHERLQRLSAGLEGLRAAQQKQQELDLLYDALCQTQADLRANVQAALVTVPAWRTRFAEAHGALLAVVAEVADAQQGIVEAGDALRRAHRIERRIQGLEGRGETGSTVQKMWDAAGGNSLDLDPLKDLELLDPQLPSWLAGRGVRFLYRPSVGLRHFFRG